MKNNCKILAIIPARGGSQRIPHKNIKNFCGKPLLGYAIEQAKNSPCVDRVFVDTDSSEIAQVAKSFGIEVPFLRPGELATGNAKIVDSIIYTLSELKVRENYEPTHVMILQTTSPLREEEDIEKCYAVLKNSDATTVVTVCGTHPKLYHLNTENSTCLVNGSEEFSTNSQDWESGYILNGAVFITEVQALLAEKKIITEKTKAVVCPKWRSVDIDIPEEWVMAEILYEQKEKIYKKIQEF